MRSSPLPYTLSMLSELEFRTGNWAAALAAATEAVSIATRDRSASDGRLQSRVARPQSRQPIGREQAPANTADQALNARRADPRWLDVVFARAPR